MIIHPGGQGNELFRNAGVYRDVVRCFNQIEQKEWKAEGAMIELARQVAELAKQVMLKEQY